MGQTHAWSPRVGMVQAMPDAHASAASRAASRTGGLTCSSPRSAAVSPASRSTIALFIHTRAVLAGWCSRALARMSLQAGGMWGLAW